MPDFSDLKLGDVILVPFPNSDLSTTKIRPAVIVQADNIDSEIPQFIVAMLSSILEGRDAHLEYLFEKAVNFGKKVDSSSIQ